MKIQKLPLMRRSSFRWSLLAVAPFLFLGSFIAFVTVTKQPAPPAEQGSVAGASAASGYETIEEKSPIAYTTKRVDDPRLPVGQSYASVKGKNGIETFVYEVKKVNGKVVQRTLLSREVTLQPVAEVVNIGSLVVTPSAPLPAAPPPQLPEVAPVPVPTPPATEEPAPNPVTVPTCTDEQSCQE